jgi:class 3 adenylate cyclase/YHS domain-containing protein
MSGHEIQIAVVIADLSGYTALTDAHGGAEAARVVTRYAALGHAALGPDARLVERVGDELLIVAPAATAALETALRLRDAVEREPNFPTVRIGVHAGPVIEEAGRYYGSALNYAARVAGFARAGQILCTAAVAAAPVGGVEFRSLGTLRLRNIATPLAVFEVVAARTGDEDVAIDPVCRMQVSPDDAPARLPFGSRTYHFCSFECAREFAQRPHVYAADH